MKKYINNIKVTDEWIRMTPEFEKLLTIFPEDLIDRNAVFSIGEKGSILTAYLYPKDIKVPLPPEYVVNPMGELIVGFKYNTDTKKYLIKQYNVVIKDGKYRYFGYYLDGSGTYTEYYTENGENINPVDFGMGLHNFTAQTFYKDNTVSPISEYIGKINVPS